ARSTARRRRASPRATPSPRSATRPTATAAPRSASSDRLGNPRLERAGDRLADRLELDPVEYVLEEAAHDQALGLGPRQAAGHQVEELLAVDAADGGAVSAAHVVREDL